MARGATCKVRSRGRRTHQALGRVERPTVHAQTTAGSAGERRRTRPAYYPRQTRTGCSGQARREREARLRGECRRVPPRGHSVCGGVAHGRDGEARHRTHRRLRHHGGAAHCHREGGHRSRVFCAGQLVCGQEPRDSSQSHQLQPAAPAAAGGRHPAVGVWVIHSDSHSTAHQS